MTKTFSFVLVISALALSGCARNQTSAAVRSAQWDNTKNWHVTCQGYSGVMYDGNTRGPVEYDETGRVSFIDAVSGKLVKSEGECVQTEL